MTSPTSDTNWILSADSNPRRGYFRYTRNVVFPEGTPRGTLVEFVQHHRGTWPEAQTRVARISKNVVSFYVCVDSGD